MAAGCAAAGALALEASEGRFGTAAGAHTGSRRDGFGAAAAAGSCALKGARGREDLRGNRSRRVGHARGLAWADLARRGNSGSKGKAVETSEVSPTRNS